jgi:hypothetical protein
VLHADAGSPAYSSARGRRMETSGANCPPTTPLRLSFRRYMYPLRPHGHPLPLHATPGLGERREGRRALEACWLTWLLSYALASAARRRRMTGIRTLGSTPQSRFARTSWFDAAAPGSPRGTIEPAPLLRRSVRAAPLRRAAVPCDATLLRRVVTLTSRRSRVARLMLLSHAGVAMAVVGSEVIGGRSKSMSNIPLKRSHPIKFRRDRGGCSLARLAGPYSGRSVPAEYGPRQNHTHYKRIGM